MANKPSVAFGKPRVKGQVCGRQRSQRKTIEVSVFFFSCAENESHRYGACRQCPARCQTDQPTNKAMHCFGQVSGLIAQSHWSRHTLSSLSVVVSLRLFVSCVFFALLCVCPCVCRVWCDLPTWPTKSRPFRPSDLLATHILSHPPPTLGLSTHQHTTTELITGLSSPCKQHTADARPTTQSEVQSSNTWSEVQEHRVISRSVFF